MKLFVGTVLVVCLGTAALAGQGDALDEALAKVGMKRADLGWQPKGWWTKFPGDIPYKLRHFDDCFAEPLAVVTLTRTLASSARLHLAPESLGKDGTRGDGPLFRAVHDLGVHPKLGAFRGYSANMTAVDTPLVEAILALHRAAGRPTKFVTFGDASPYPRYEEELNELVEVIPAQIEPKLGRLVMAIIDAHHWSELAFRNVPMSKRVAAAKRMNIGQEQVDALDYAPEFDDIARAWDEASLWYAAQMLTQALDVVRLDLRESANVPDFAFDWETPWGWLRFRGSGDDQVDGHDALLIVDLGGDDLYTGPVAAGLPDQSISLLLDLGGNDIYQAPGPAQGAGLCGVGILVDVKGADRYRARRYAQGVGQFGLGACIDLDGDDDYFVRYSGQGCGYFGIGLLLEANGDDKYELYADGQGCGGVAGVGVLADRLGNDHYEAVRDPEITKRPSYHSDLEIAVSNAQGCAMGRRGDGADGHSWAGGLGALIDVEGHDYYTSGNWSQGTGYWFGTGLLYDGSGDDEYHGVAYSQATGAHFCIGALIDEGGNDLHSAEETSNMCMAWGHDFTVALLVNIGGDDVYTIAGEGISYSINRSVTMLIDVGGDDQYTGKEERRPGMAKSDEKFHDRSGLSTYFADTTSIGLFLDVGGTDTYWSGHENDTEWLDPDDSPNNEVRNFSIGVDRQDGTVDLSPHPEKLPSPE